MPIRWGRAARGHLQETDDTNRDRPKSPPNSKVTHSALAVQVGTFRGLIVGDYEGEAGVA